MRCETRRERRGEECRAHRLDARESELRPGIGDEDAFRADFARPPFTSEKCENVSLLSRAIFLSALRLDVFS